MQPIETSAVSAMSGSGRPDIDRLLSRLQQQRAARAAAAGVGGAAGPAARGPKPQADPGAGAGEDPRWAAVMNAVGQQLGPEAAQRLAQMRAQRSGGPLGTKGGGDFPGGTATDPGFVEGASGEAAVPLPNDALPPPAARQPRQDLSGAVTQDGQQGLMGRGGRFQELGAAARRRLPPASGPIVDPAQVPGGYVTQEQYDNNPMFDWFRHGEAAAGNPVDHVAFNNWFRQNGRQFDPAGWDRAYGNGQAAAAVPPGAPQTATVNPDGSTTVGHGEQPMVTDVAAGAPAAPPVTTSVNRTPRMLPRMNAGGDALRRPPSGGAGTTKPMGGVQTSPQKPDPTDTRPTTKPFEPTKPVQKPPIGGIKRLGGFGGARRGGF